MRAAFAGICVLVLAACGGPDQAEGPEAGEAEEAAAAPAAEGGVKKIPATIADTLTIVCGGAFSQDATAGTLADLFGAENVIPETIDGPKGPRNVTAIYPHDRSRRIEVTFLNEEERTVLTSVTIHGEASEWTGPGGLNLGDGIETVERLNKRPFTLTGFGGDQGGYVADWQGGALQAILVGLLLVLTLLLGFIVMNWQQAASELQQVQAEAPIVGSTLTGFAVGLVLWLIYALGFGALRADWQRARTGRRIGGLLR